MKKKSHWWEPSNTVKDLIPERVCVGRFIKGRFIVDKSTHVCRWCMEIDCFSCEDSSNEEDYE